MLSSVGFIKILAMKRAKRKDRPTPDIKVTESGLTVEIKGKGQEEYLKQVKRTLRH